jgi:hypothetical protein
LKPARLRAIPSLDGEVAGGQALDRTRYALALALVPAPASQRHRRLPLRAPPPRPASGKATGERRHRAAATRATSLAREVARCLAVAIPSPRCELHHRDAWELVVATILSAQCTDQRVNAVTPRPLPALAHATCARRRGARGRRGDGPPDRLLPQTRRRRSSPPRGRSSATSGAACRGRWRRC